MENAIIETMQNSITIMKLFKFISISPIDSDLDDRCPFYLIPYGFVPYGLTASSFSDKKLINNLIQIDLEAFILYALLRYM